MTTPSAIGGEADGASRHGGGGGPGCQATCARLCYRQAVYASLLPQGSPEVPSQPEEVLQRVELLLHGEENITVARGRSSATPLPSCLKRHIRSSPAPGAAKDGMSDPSSVPMDKKITHWVPPLAIDAEYREDAVWVIEARSTTQSTAADDIGGLEGHQRRFAAVSDTFPPESKLTAAVLREEASSLNISRRRSHGMETTTTDSATVSDPGRRCSGERLLAMLLSSAGHTPRRTQSAAETFLPLNSAREQCTEDGRATFAHLGRSSSTGRAEFLSRPAPPSKHLRGARHSVCSPSNCIQLSERSDHSPNNLVAKPWDRSACPAAFDAEPPSEGTRGDASKSSDAASSATHTFSPTLERNGVSRDSHLSSEVAGTSPPVSPPDKNPRFPREVSSFGGLEAPLSPEMRMTSGDERDEGTSQPDSSQGLCLPGVFNRREADPLGPVVGPFAMFPTWAEEAAAKPPPLPLVKWKTPLFEIKEYIAEYDCYCNHPIRLPGGGLMTLGAELTQNSKSPRARRDTCADEGEALRRGSPRLAHSLADTPYPREAGWSDDEEDDDRRTKSARSAHAVASPATHYLSPRLNNSRSTAQDVAADPFASRSRDLLASEKGDRIRSDLSLQESRSDAAKESDDPVARIPAGEEASVALWEV